MDDFTIYIQELLRLLMLLVNNTGQQSAPIVVDAKPDVVDVWGPVVLSAILSGLLVACATWFVQQQLINHEDALERRRMSLSALGNLADRARGTVLEPLRVQFRHGDSARGRYSVVDARRTDDVRGLVQHRDFAYIPESVKADISSWLNAEEAVTDPWDKVWAVLDEIAPDNPIARLLVAIAVGEPDASGPFGGTDPIAVAAANEDKIVWFGVSIISPAKDPAVAKRLSTLLENTAPDRLQLLRSLINECRRAATEADVAFEVAKMSVESALVTADPNIEALSTGA